MNCYGFKNDAVCELNGLKGFTANDYVEGKESVQDVALQKQDHTDTNGGAPQIGNAADEYYTRRLRRNHRIMFVALVVMAGALVFLYLKK